MNLPEIKNLVSNISLKLFNTDFNIRVERDNKDPDNGRIFIQVVYVADCNKSGAPKEWHGRKWYLSDFMTEDEIVKTCFVAFKSVVEHEVMEAFKFNDVIVFNPHADFRELIKVSHKEVMREEKQQAPKVYNTIEDILNDHELMRDEHFKISVEILRKLEYSLEFRDTYESIKGSNIWEKTEWLKFEYKRRQKEKSQLIHANTILLSKEKPMENKPNTSYKQGGYEKKYIISKENGNPIDPKADYFVLRLDEDPHARKALIAYMESVKSDNEQLANDLKNKLVNEYGYSFEKKPNLIPFDLEKAKAGAKVCYREAEAKIVYENDECLLIVFKINKEEASTWVSKNDYEGLSIESEPLPEMWMPVFKSNTSIENYHSGAIFNTQKDADEFGKKFEKYIGTAKLHFE